MQHEKGNVVLLITNIAKVMNYIIGGQLQTTTQKYSYFPRVSLYDKIGTLPSNSFIVHPNNKVLLIMWSFHNWENKIIYIAMQIVIMSGWRR